MLRSTFWNEWRNRWVSSLKKRGVARTIKHAIVYFAYSIARQWKLYAVWSPWNPWYCYLDRRFDRRFAVDTAGVLILPESHSDPRFNGYSPTPHFLFSRLMREVNIDYSGFTFIDFGCGKGKALLLAAKFPFRRIIGVELSSELIGIANDNLRTYRGKRCCKIIELVHGDARDFKFPEEPSIYYFWDPFEAELMQTVVQNLRDSLMAAPREIFIFYFVPVHQHLLRESGFLTLVKQASWYCIYSASSANEPSPAMN